MANSYTLFSSQIPCATHEQFLWLIRRLTAGYPDPQAPETEVLPYCAFDGTPDERTVQVYAEEEDDHNLDALAGLVAEFQREFSVEVPFFLSWAQVCDKARMGEFGGGCLVVYRGETYTVNPKEVAEGWVRQRT